MTGFDRLLAALDVTAGPFALDATLSPSGRTFGASNGDALYYVLSGAGAVRVSGQADAAVGPETLLLVPAGLACRFESDTALEVVRGPVRATFGGASDPFARLKAPLVASLAARPMRESFLTIVEDRTSRQIGARALAECVVKQALVLLLRAQVAAGREAPLPWAVAARDERLARAVSAMLERPSDPLTLDALARLAGMSRSAFSERFGAAFGQSPIDFLKGVRLAQAARMLATTDLPVKRIASAVGYGSRSYFSRAFRSRYDRDPSDYRVRSLAAA